MQYGVMITNGGAHPPEKWAIATAEQICPVSDELQGSRLIEAKRVQLAVMEAILPHHKAHQDNERHQLKTAGDAVLDGDHNPMPRAEEALQAVIACLAGSPWEDKTKDKAWQGVVGGVLATHFATSADIERQWHCHRNPSDKTRAFMTKRVGPIIEVEKSEG